MLKTICGAALRLNLILDLYHSLSMLVDDKENIIKALSKFLSGKKIGVKEFYTSNNNSIGKQLNHRVDALIRGGPSLSFALYKCVSSIIRSAGDNSRRLKIE